MAREERYQDREYNEQRSGYGRAGRQEPRQREEDRDDLRSRGRGHDRFREESEEDGYYGQGGRQQLQGDGNRREFGGYGGQSDAYGDSRGFADRDDYSRRRQWSDREAGSRGGAGTRSPGLDDRERAGWGFVDGDGSIADMDRSATSGRQRQQGQHMGKGPKGWSRSDDRLKDDVSEALARHPELDASEIEVECANGEIKLTGTVRERSAKRLAEDIAEQVFGVNDVQNSIRVQREENGNTSMTDGADTSSGNSGRGSRSGGSARTGQMQS